jgi:hypothetical protein
MATFLGFETLKLDELIPFPGNARRGDVEGIRTSIKAHGQYRSLVVRRTGGGDVVLAGNHTMRALIAEGYTQARCEVVECSDADAIKITVGDNGWADKATNDEQALAELLELLEGDFEGTSYTQHDYEDFKGLWDPTGETTPDLDSLATELGDPVDSDLWPTLRFKVPPSVRDDFYDLTNNAPNPNDDNNRFMHLIQKVRAAA